MRLVRESLVERERLLRTAPHLVRPLHLVIPRAPWRARSAPRGCARACWPTTCSPLASRSTATACSGAPRPRPSSPASRSTACAAPRCTRTRRCRWSSGSASRTCSTPGPWRHLPHAHPRHRAAARRRARRRRRVHGHARRPHARRCARRWSPTWPAPGSTPCGGSATARWSAAWAAPAAATSCCRCGTARRARRCTWRPAATAAPSRSAAGGAGCWSAPPTSRSTATPADVPVEPWEIDYLLAEVNAEFPRARLGRDDVVLTTGGQRPLLRQDGRGAWRHHARAHRRGRRRRGPARPALGDRRQGDDVPAAGGGGRRPRGRGDRRRARACDTADAPLPGGRRGRRRRPVAGAHDPGAGGRRARRANGGAPRRRLRHPRRGRRGARGGGARARPRRWCPGGPSWRPRSSWPSRTRAPARSRTSSTAAPWPASRRASGWRTCGRWRSSAPRATAGTPPPRSSRRPRRRHPRPAQGPGAAAGARGAGVAASAEGASGLSDPGESLLGVTPTRAIRCHSGDSRPRWPGDHSAVADIRSAGDHRAPGSEPRPQAEGVSVVIATHNRRELVQRAIRCAAGQIGVQVEIIVVDDGSSDGTPDVLPRVEGSGLDRDTQPAAARRGSGSQPGSATSVPPVGGVPRRR